MVSRSRASVRRNGWVRLALLALGLLAAALLVWLTGASRHLSLENLGKLETWIGGLGFWGPAVYILLYVAATIAFLPAWPLTLLAGIFGVARGTIYVSIGSTVGASLAFLIARYALRPTVESWIAGRPAFLKLDDGVRKHGWRMVMITRLVPVFPFNLQNYAYGLTSIPFWIYALVSWICMLPVTVAYVFAGGSVLSGGREIRKTLIYLAVAAVAFVSLSFLPGLIARRYGIAKDDAARTVHE